MSTIARKTDYRHKRKSTSDAIVAAIFPSVALKILMLDFIFPVFPIFTEAVVHINKTRFT
jgi:hypothetical protein